MNRGRPSQIEPYREPIAPAPYEHPMDSCGTDCVVCQRRWDWDQVLEDKARDRSK